MPNKKNVKQYITDKLCHRLFPHIGEHVEYHETKQCIEMMLYRLFSVFLKENYLIEKIIMLIRELILQELYVKKY